MRADQDAGPLGTAVRADQDAAAAAGAACALHGRLCAQIRTPPPLGAAMHADQAGAAVGGACASSGLDDAVSGVGADAGGDAVVGA